MKNSTRCIRLLFCLGCAFVVVHVTVYHFVTFNNYDKRYCYDKKSYAFATDAKKAKSSSTDGSDWSMGLHKQTSDYKSDSVSNTSHLLISAYMRSGSTFVSMIINEQPDVFYVHEPLWQFTMMGYFTANDSFCDSVLPECWNISKKQGIKNETLPFLKNGERPVVGILRALKNFYMCRFNEPKFDLITDYVDKMSASFNYRGWKKYFGCKNTGKVNLTKCLKILHEECKAIPVILTKVLRLSVDVLELLLIEDRNLKIIHLIRDPRAVVYSRIARTSWYPLGKENRNNITVTQNAKALCQKMWADLNAGLEILKKYPDKFMFVRYEDLTGSRSVEIQQKLLNFTGIRKQIKLVASHREEMWRTWMNQDSYEEVNRACGDLIHRLGYKLMLNKAERKAVQITGYVHSSELGFLNY